MRIEIEDAMKPWFFRHYDVDLIRYTLRIRPLCRPTLMHLLYLIDREVCLKYGRYMYNWEMTYTGPSSSDVLDIINHMVKYRSVVPNIELGFVIYELKSNAPIELPDELRTIADKVLDTWDHRKLDELMEYVRSLDEVGDSKLGDRLYCKSKK
ncbi:MAG: hypothetical protein ACO2PN_21865 [Pyrobaculum sp.]